MMFSEPIVLQEHTDTIRSLVFSPDGANVASLSIQNDKRVIVWSTETWTPLHAFYSGAGTTTLWFTPDSKTLIGTGVNKEILFWNILSESTDIRNTPHINGSIRFTPPQNASIIYCQKQALLFYDLQTQNLQKLVPLPTAHSILFGHCGWINRQASLCALEIENHDILLWDIEQMQLQSRLTYHHSHIMDIDYHNNGMLLGSVSDNGSIAIWDIQQGSLMQTLQSNAPNIFSIVFHPQHPILALINGEEYIELWDIEKRVVLRTLEGHGEQITAAFSPDGKFLVTGSDDNTLKVWQL